MSTGRMDGYCREMRFGCSRLMWRVSAMAMDNEL